MISRCIQKQWQEQIDRQPTVKFSLGIIENRKAESEEDVNEVFLEKRNSRLNTNKYMPCKIEKEKSIIISPLYDT